MSSTKPIPSITPENMIHEMLKKTLHPSLKSSSSSSTKSDPIVDKISDDVASLSLQKSHSSTLPIVTEKKKTRTKTVDKTSIKKTKEVVGKSNTTSVPTKKKLVSIDEIDFTNPDILVPSSITLSSELPEDDGTSALILKNKGQIDPQKINEGFTFDELEKLTQEEEESSEEEEDSEDDEDEREEEVKEVDEKKQVIKGTKNSTTSSKKSKVIEIEPIDEDKLTEDDWENMRKKAEERRGMTCNDIATMILSKYTTPEECAKVGLIHPCMPEKFRIKEEEEDQKSEPKTKITRKISTKRISKTPSKNNKKI